jgi:hypothetical protein
LRGVIAMSENPPATKRTYISRKGEFENCDVEQTKVILQSINTDLKTVKAKLKATPADEALLKEKKELNNKLVRAYTRLRKLGYNSREEQKKRPKPVSTEALPPVPENVPPAQ